MDNNSQTPNNTNNSGISGFGSQTPNANNNATNQADGNPPTVQNQTPPAPEKIENKSPKVDSIQGFPEQKADNNQPPVPPQPSGPQETPAKENNVNVPPETNQNMPENRPAPSILPATEIPKPVEAPGGLEPTQNFTKQTIVGGVEDSEPKSKGLFSRSPHSQAPKEQMEPEEPSDKQSYNEVTAVGNHKKFAIIAIIVGVLLLSLTGAGYYYFMILNNPSEEVVANPDVVPQEEVVPEVVEDLTIEQDPYILQISQLEATASAGPTTIESQLNMLDLENIDNEIMISSDQAPTTEAQEEALPQ